MQMRIFSHRLIVVCGLILAIFVLGVSAPAEMARVSAAHPGHDEATPSSSDLSTSAVVVVHPNNALDCLSIEQLHRLWRDGSAIESWNDLDPNLGDDPIALHAPAPGTAAYEAFSAVLGEDETIRSDATLSQSEDQTIEGVATEEHAAGVVSYASFVEMQRPLKAIAVDAGEGCVEPSPATIDDGSYVPTLATGNAETA